MKCLTLALATLCSLGCSSSQIHNNHSSNSQLPSSNYLQQILPGQWAWEEGPSECINHANMAFRRDGSYTYTSESCDFADDGFGLFYYGWYLVDNYLCFVVLEEQFTEQPPAHSTIRKKYLKAKRAGFVPSRCSWEIIQAERDQLSIRQLGDQEQRLILRRKKWL